MDDTAKKRNEDEGTLQTVEIEMDPDNEDFELGMNLTRSLWDPYPWVAFVLENGPADRSGVKAGDVLLSIQESDLVGLKISSIAAILKSLTGPKVHLTLWTNAKHSDCDPESLCCGPLPSGLSATKAALTSILTALECPVCGGTWSTADGGFTGIQCTRGHLLCGKCRKSINNCPMCRAPLYSTKDPRSKNIFAETVYTSIVDAFRMDQFGDALETHSCLNRRIFGNSPRRPRIPIVRIDGVSSCHDLTGGSCDSIAARRCSRCLEDKSPKKATNKLLARILTATNNMPWRAKSVGDLSKPESALNGDICRSASATNVNNPDVCECGRAIGGSNSSSTNGVAGSMSTLSVSESALNTVANQTNP